jgi:hypothetical protein
VLGRTEIVLLLQNSACYERVLKKNVPRYFTAEDGDIVFDIVTFMRKTLHALLLWRMAILF